MCPKKRSLQNYHNDANCGKSKPSRRLPVFVLSDIRGEEKFVFEFHYFYWSILVTLWLFQSALLSPFRYLSLQGKICIGLIFPSYSEIANLIKTYFETYIAKIYILSKRTFGIIEIKFLSLLSTKLSLEAVGCLQVSTWFILFISEQL